VTGYLAVFSSLNQVALLKRALSREGVYADMVRTPQCYAANGCSFALRCQPGDIPRLKEACRKWNVEPGGIFEEIETDSAPDTQSLLEEG
jgi:hypothetical protein